MPPWFNHQGLQCRHAGRALIRVLCCVVLLARLASQAGVGYKLFQRAPSLVSRVLRHRLLNNLVLTVVEASAGELGAVYSSSSW